MSILLQLLLLVLFIHQSSGADFSPDLNDYDAFGLKIAANSLMIVEAQNYYTQFLIQFAPFTDNVTQTSAQSCIIEYDDPSQFVYGVALGKSQTTYDIFYVGELIDVASASPLVNRTFVNILRYTGSTVIIDCVSGFTSIENSITTALVHQEHLVMTTDPLGLVAYGFSDLFTFAFTAATNTLVVHLNNSLSSSAAFLPFAVDYDGTLGVIAGFLDNGRNSLVKYRATVILFSVSSITAIATPLSNYTYTANGTAWQAGQTNAGADQYTAKYDMSVSVNPTATQALVGIQSTNTVFLFSYTATTLTFVSSLSNGQAIGFGKGVAWLSYTLNTFAILANVYSTNYVWSSSKIYVYESALTSTSIPTTVFPGIQQPLYAYMSSVFLNIVTTPSALVLLDDQGGLFVILPAVSSYYSSTVGPSTQIVPAFSSSLLCIPGTYKNTTGIGRCQPCPTGTKNEGNSPTTSICVTCAANTFCPLGSTSDVSTDLLNNFTQALAYPTSPSNTEIDDILFFALFALGSTGRCVAVSPIFWTLIVASIAVIIGVSMLILRHFIKTPRSLAHYKTMRKVFKQTDVVGEGEMWSGGLATFCILILCIFCYAFSTKFYNQYPIETAGPSTFTCDTTIRNAKFTTSLRSLSVPVSDDVQTIVDLLNNQAVYINVAFINTIYNCSSDAVTLAYLIETTWTPISSLSCNYSGYTLSYSALLPYKLITIQFSLPNIYMIGGIRVGLSGVGQAATAAAPAETLRDLGFSQTFSRSGMMLGQSANVAIELTKVINDTAPLESGNDTYTGLWIAAYTINYFESFLNNSGYLYATGNSTTNLTVVITEAPYYVLNLQEPISKKNELIFHNLLFTTVVIKIFGLLFIIIQLAILPLVKLGSKKCRPSIMGNNRVGHGTSDRRRSAESSGGKLKQAPSNSNEQQNLSNVDSGDDHHLDKQQTDLNPGENNKDEGQPTPEVTAVSSVVEVPRKPSAVV